MSETTGSTATTPSGSASEPGASEGRSVARRESDSGSQLVTERGTTTISSSVVAKIAALATQEIPGVQAMGKTLSRTMGALRARIPGASQAADQGVTVEVGERQAAVDLDIVCHYGQSIVEVTEAIRENVIDRIEGMTGLEVVEVNINVNDLYLESEDDNGGSRVG
jgi:uncharacterized alkaline shock family protein YloU